MLMPKTTMNKDDFPASWQDDIRPPRKVVPVQPEAIAHRMDKTPNGKFRLHIFAPNSAHVAATVLRRNSIHGLRSTSI
jgi:hypothetical protein